ncbi:DUF3046 domain-containing protein [Catellatospora vulcania]|uniref:DUF3046 domain-containing protein n=1 Tax=Catellatospora vulcania TaxID=1460450 RepID=UPI0012D3959F|nr:DUF3046 domain-containing protein [Catellatospora vulcania]
MRRTDFYERLTEVFGPAYAASVAADQVLPQLGGRTIDTALADGEEVHVIWRAVCEQYSERVPGRLR